jgi:hypothetical protein
MDPSAQAINTLITSLLLASLHVLHHLRTYTHLTVEQADSQTIGAATTYSGMVAPPDGMLGMAFAPLSTYPASPVFETLVDEEKVTEPVFSIKLIPAGGELYLGGTNEALYSGNIIYTPVTEEVS